MGKAVTWLLQAAIAAIVWALTSAPWRALNMRPSRYRPVGSGRPERASGRVGYRVSSGLRHLELMWPPEMP